MTKQRSFKTRIRTRMGKTGESYAAARRQLLAKTTATPTPAVAVAEPDQALEAARISDAAIRERTGRGWDEWFALLDAWGATGHNHTEIARWLRTEHDVDSWSSQSVSVAYEQARGLRAIGQNSRGDFTASATRTVAVAPEALFEAFADDDMRARWLPDAEVAVRTATPPKSFRADWDGGPSRIIVAVVPKGEARSQVAILHEKLADAADVAARKAYWRDRFTALKTLLEA
jgi:hypothetical protein